MKNYKEFMKWHIGTSDIAALVMVGFKNDIGATTQLLEFGKDDSYYAYVCEGEVEIGKHYELVAEYQCWLKIYDDTELVRKFNGKTIRVYRAGEVGCVINILK